VAKSLIKDVLFEETHDNAMNPKKDSSSAGGNTGGNQSGNTGGGTTPTPPADESDYDQPSGD